MCVCVMRNYRASSFPFVEEVPKTKLKTVSTKVGDFPHHTTYHITNILLGNSGMPDLPYLVILGRLTYPIQQFWAADLPCLAIMGCRPALWFNFTNYRDYFTPTTTTK